MTNSNATGSNACSQNPPAQPVELLRCTLNGVSTDWIPGTTNFESGWSLLTEAASQDQTAHDDLSITRLQWHVDDVQSVMQILLKGKSHE